MKKNFKFKLLKKHLTIALLFTSFTAISHTSEILDFSNQHKEELDQICGNLPNVKQVLYYYSMHIHQRSEKKTHIIGVINNGKQIIDNLEKYLISNNFRAITDVLDGLNDLKINKYYIFLRKKIRSDNEFKELYKLEHFDPNSFFNNETNKINDQNIVHAIYNYRELAQVVQTCIESFQDQSVGDGINQSGDVQLGETAATAIDHSSSAALQQAWIRANLLKYERINTEQNFRRYIAKLREQERSISYFEFFLQGLFLRKDPTDMANTFNDEQSAPGDFELSLIQTMVITPPDPSNWDSAKPYALEQFLGNYSLDFFFQKLDELFIVNREIPNAYVGLSPQKRLEKQIQFIKNNNIRKLICNLTTIFINSRKENFTLNDETQSSNVRYTRQINNYPIEPRFRNENLHLDNSQDAIVQRDPDIMVFNFDMFRDLSTTGEPILPCKEVIKNLFGTNEWGGGAVVRLTQWFDIISSFEGEAVPIVRGGLSSAQLEFVYFISKTLIALDRYKTIHTSQTSFLIIDPEQGQLRVEIYQDLIKELFVRLASAGGHCENGLNEIITIFLSAQKKLGLVDEDLDSQLNSVDEKIQYVLFNLREKVFKNVILFKHDGEAKATDYNYRLPFSDFIKISAPRADLRYRGCGLFPCIPIYRTQTESVFNFKENTFLTRFFEGKKDEGPQYQELRNLTLLRETEEQKRIHHGYDVKQIFIAIWNAVNYPSVNPTPTLGNRFESKFLEEIVNYMSSEDPLTQVLLDCDEVIDRYIVHVNRSTDLNNFDEIQTFRQYLKSNLDKNALALLKTSNLIVTSNKHNRSYWVGPEIIVDYLLRNRIILLH